MAVIFEDWREETFRKALVAGKPILLSVSVRWSQASEEMDRQTYSHPEVVSLLNDNFVPVRVDAGQRPDVNARYNQGGWPSTVFLTPAGEVITGATFLSAADFLEFARRVLVIYQSLVAQGRLSGILNSGEVSGGSDEDKLDFAAKEAFFESDQIHFVRRFEQEVKNKFDPLYGGFGSAPKFPESETLRFCLYRHLQTGDPELRRILTESLEALAEGGLFDHLEGGFFRGSADRRLTTVFSEKLLEDNLKLIQIYDEAGRRLSEGRFLVVAERTFSFIKNWLLADPFFYTAVATRADYYGLLSRSERSKAEKPPVERVVFAGLNGLAASVLKQMGQTEAARILVDRLCLDFRDEAGLFTHGLARGAGTLRWLPDQVFPLEAMISLGAETAAVELVRTLLTNFYDEEKGGFFDRRREEGEFGLLKKRLKPLAENLRLIRLLRRFNHDSRARKSLVEIFSLYREPRLSHAPLATFLVNTVLTDVLI